jgi:thioredoxin 1
MSPIFETLSLHYNNVIFIKVDVDRAPEIKNLLGVWALPTFCFLRNGEKISSVTGANARSLRQGLENNGDIGYCSSCVVV